MPRDARAVEGLGHIDTFGAPEPGFAEQVYFYDLLSDPKDGRTLAMLRDRAGVSAIVLRFDRGRLPAFSLWKNTGGLKSGYVTGLEPATNYPNPKPFEKARGRVVMIPPGGEFVAETTLEVLTTPESLAVVDAEIKRIQAITDPTIHRAPVEPFVAEA